MTCAACHTGRWDPSRATQHGGFAVDGAPASANFQLFLTELTAAARATLDEFRALRHICPRGARLAYSASRANTLKGDFKKWGDEFGGFMDKSLPASHGDRDGWMPSA